MEYDEKKTGESGFILPLSLIFLAILVLVGATGAIFTNTDTHISNNFNASVVVFSGAEAGLEEARERLRTTSSSPIPDSHQTSAQWRAFIGTESQVNGKGYNNTNTMHYRTDSIQTALNYSVVIQHQVNASGQILYWGDANADGQPERNTTVGGNIYLITSECVFRDARKSLQLEVVPMLPIDPPAALYVEANTTIQGSSTSVRGEDFCGTSNKPGIATILDESTIRLNGSHPTITGDPAISDYVTNLPVTEMVNELKAYADHSYTSNSDTVTGSATPGPGDGWGNPVVTSQSSPSTCATFEIVYYNTNNTDVKLSGGVTGCGILLIDGDLYVNGGFTWYGMVVATGSITFLGGGEKNISGAVISGGSANADVVGGNTAILRCSAALDPRKVPLRVLTWLEGT
jgi:Tfp pilus assembly protein PilX